MFSVKRLYKITDFQVIYIARAKVKKNITSSNEEQLYNVKDLKIVNDSLI